MYIFQKYNFLLIWAWVFCLHWLLLVPMIATLLLVIISTFRSNDWVRDVFAKFLANKNMNLGIKLHFFSLRIMGILGKFGHLEAFFFPPSAPEHL